MCGILGNSKKRGGGGASMGIISGSQGDCFAQGNGEGGGVTAHKECMKHCEPLEEVCKLHEYARRTFPRGTNSVRKAQHTPDKL